MSEVSYLRHRIVKAPDRDGHPRNAIVFELALGDRVERMMLDAVDKVRLSARGQGFAVSKEARRALELYSMNMVTGWYRAEDYAVEDVSAGQPYDLRCTKGKDLEYVEVKGTTTAGEDVLLTPREVEFARAHHTCMALAVVHSIKLTGSRKHPEPRGGQIRMIRPWRIDDGELKATGYVHKVPMRTV